MGAGKIGRASSVEKVAGRHRIASLWLGDRKRQFRVKADPSSQRRASVRANGNSISEAAAKRKPFLS